MALHIADLIEGPVYVEQIPIHDDMTDLKKPAYHIRITQASQDASTSQYAHPTPNKTALSQATNPDTWRNPEKTPKSIN